MADAFESLVDKFMSVQRHRALGQFAVHKPLLLLLALSKLHIESKEEYSFQEIDSELQDLLRKYGGNKGHRNTHYPFWRLQNDDNIWVIKNAKSFPKNKSGDVSKAELINKDCKATFSENVLSLLRKSDSIRKHLMLYLIEETFPESYWPGLINDLHIDDTIFYVTHTVTRRKRDPKFKMNVLDAYKQVCCICGLSCSIYNNTPIEAAHIQFHSSEGPDHIKNGLALCKLHHWAFDFGAITINADYLLQISTKFQSNSVAKQLINQHDNKKINLPSDEKMQPSQDYLRWHHNEIFKG